MSKSSTSYFIPVLLLVALIFLLWSELRSPANPYSSSIEGTPVPEFQTTSLWADTKPFTQKELLNQVSLLHVWGAWCSACRHEHPMLLEIQRTYHVPIYSLDYKDNPEDAKNWLTENGNPFVQTGLDPSGKISKSLGVFGTPETFLIDKHGIIRYRHVGTIDKATWLEEIFPLINKYRNED